MLGSSDTSAAVIEPSSVTDIQPTAIGSGGSSEVFRARYDGDPVVIKRMKYSVGVGDYVIQAFKKEAAIFARLNHARIVRFFGVITEQGCISLILEDMSHGSLLDFYKAQPEASVQDRVQWALDIAFGMQYLHTRTPPIIHRDLKSPNVLMALEGNGSLRAKVTDFGSAVLQLATATRMHSKQPTLAGTTLFWRAPELSGFRLKFNTATDVFAYGVILTELVSWQGPFGCPLDEINVSYFEACQKEGKSIEPDLDDCDVPDALKRHSIEMHRGFTAPSIQLMAISGVKLKQESNGISDAPVKTARYEKQLPDRINTSRTLRQDSSEKSVSSGSVETVQFNVAETQVPSRKISRAIRKDTTLVSEDVPAFVQVDESIQKFEAVDGDAQARLGISLLTGDGVDKNYQQAVKCFMKGARAGNATAQLNLADCLHYGIGVGPNLTEAVEWYRKAAEQDNAAAQSGLGYCLFDGIGIEKDTEEAFEWFRKAADQGNAAAQTSLGICLLEGIGTDTNTVEALKWIRKGADRGHVIAQLTLGYCSQEGIGMEWNYQEAFRWYKKAAMEGNPCAQYKLGECYQNGYGVGKNAKEAVEWYQKAADVGNADAQYKLGECFMDGIGTQKNQQEALKWFELAADQNHELALLKAPKSAVAGDDNDLSKIDEEFVRHRAKMIKLEQEMTDVFQQKVKEKEAKLKQAEDELYSRHRDMKNTLDSTFSELEEKKSKLLEQASASTNKVKPKRGLFIK